MSGINTNINSINAQRNLASTASVLSTAMQRLSSGLRINSAADDSAGLAIAERMDGQTRGMNVAVRNANDAISMAQTADGALASISANLQRMRELAVQAANGTNTATDVASISAEYAQLDAENQRVIGGTTFNKQNVLQAVNMNFQVGANTTANDQINITTAAAATTNAGTITAATATAQITALDADIDTITTLRGTWGAAQNRFQSVISNLRVGAENSAAAHGRIVDADYAQETSNLSRAQVLQQAGTAMVAQANQGPNGVLALLR